ncbi:MAG TPA: NAD(P)/FAD-dependent oxidoreductase [Chitinispirillaceae bacterium]|nr:NAD(P)/FAD-dependent oxidoreductase [Chitinispirillaceae bacterium]
MEKRRIAIIGAGASGMIAAITAARSGADVTVFERNDRIGKKLLATGNGQCNLTNLNCDHSHFHGENPHFVDDAFKCFTINETTGFFNSLGALTVAENDGRMYPRTYQASTILDVLRFELDSCGITVKTQTPIISVKKNKSNFTLFSEDIHFTSDAVIVSCGSRAAPQLGGSSSGVDILNSLGHSSTATFPVLVPLKTDFPHSRHLKGTKVLADISLIINDKKVTTDYGEILFTEYGLSGPPVIQLSILVNTALHQNKKVKCTVDLFPDKTYDELIEHLHKRFTNKSTFSIDTSLIGFINKRLITSVITESGITDPKKMSCDIHRVEINRIAATVKKWAFTITGSLSWNDAHVCAGGIKTSEFNSATMESGLVEGLYATGEVLDITGDCGGYNLQWAWSSGVVAGRSAAKGEQ